jgi:hypothetical protein
MSGKLISMYAFITEYALKEYAKKHLLKDIELE